jgi:signal transduction histidine kinase
MVTQVGAPRLATVGLTQADAARIATVLNAAETATLELGPETGDELQALAPDLVVVDITTDGGLGLVRELKLMPETHFIAVLAVGPPAAAAAAFAAGVDHVIDPSRPDDELRARADWLLRSTSFVRALRESRHELRLRRDWVRYLVHDLRNYLTKAIGDLALATRKAASDPAAAQGLVTRGEEELWRCTALLGDLLDVDRIKKGMLNLRRSPVDLVALLRSVAGNFRDTAARRRVQIRVIADGALVAQVDAALVERVLSNLVANALRFAPEGTPVTLLATSREGGALLEVENRGPSIPPERMSEIFEPFVRSDDQADAAGAGLGLAFCRLAVDLHGGTISVSEPEGGGARFRIDLP